MVQVYTTSLVCGEATPNEQSGYLTSKVSHVFGQKNTQASSNEIQLNLNAG